MLIQMAPVLPTNAKNLRNPGNLFSQAPSSSVSLGPLRTPNVGGHSHKEPAPGKGPFSLYIGRHVRGGVAVWASVACSQPDYLDLRSHPIAVPDFRLSCSTLVVI